MKSKEVRKEKVYLYGKHALVEALTSRPDVVRKAFLAPDVTDPELHSLLQKHGIPVAELSKNAATDVVGRDVTHQGVIATIDPSKLLLSLPDFLSTLDMEKQPAVAVLGEVQDPHNVGAIIRSAAAFGFSGVLIPEHNQAGITGTVIKTSAGMTFRIPLVSIGNVNNTLEVLKKKGFWIYGLDMEGSSKLSDEKFDAPTVIVIGNEGKGIREKTLEACDITLSIPMHARTESLNAAVSAGIVFFAWSARHPESL